MGPRSERFQAAHSFNIDLDSLKSLHFPRELKTLTVSLGGNGRMGLVWFSLRLLLSRETLTLLSEFSSSSSNSPWFWDQTALSHWPLE